MCGRTIQPTNLVLGAGYLLPREEPLAGLWFHTSPATARRAAGELLHAFAALRWIAAYERWVRGEVGIDYRHRCVAAFPFSTIPAERMAVTWSDIAWRYERRAALLCAVQRNQCQKEKVLHV